MSRMPRVLLLGDSIRISYQPHVAELFKGKAEIVGPAENCQYSLYTLSSLDRWIEELGEPIMVHWNNGLHDVGHNPSRNPVQISVHMYRDNLAFILEKLRALTPTVIWATTTPVRPDRPFLDTRWSWRQAEIDRYNKAARGLMEANGVPVNDLHAEIRANLNKYLSDDHVHLSPAGQKTCAQAVAQAISARLSS